MKPPARGAIHHPGYLYGPCPLPPYPTHQQRHRPGEITVPQLFYRLWSEQRGSPIRQVVKREGERPYLEQIDIYGKRTMLGRLPRTTHSECTCAMTESSMVSCPSHGYDAPES